MPRSPSRHGVDPSEAIAITAAYCVAPHTPVLYILHGPSTLKTAKAPNAAAAATA